MNLLLSQYHLSFLSSTSGMPEISVHSQWKYCSKLFKVSPIKPSLPGNNSLTIISKLCGSLNYFSDSQYHWCQFLIHCKLLTLVARHGFNKYIFLHLVVKWWRRWWWCLALQAKDAFVITTLKVSTIRHACNLSSINQMGRTQCTCHTILIVFYIG